MTQSFPEVRLQITQDLIDAYAELSGDFNPLHVDPLIAARSPFGSTIAHGPIALQAFFAAITEWLEAETLPQGAIVRVVYRSPVRPGDEVVCSALSLEETDREVIIEAACTVGGTTVVSVTTILPVGGRLQRR